MEITINGKTYQVEEAKSVWLGNKVIHDNQEKTVTGLHHELIELDFKKNKLVLLTDIFKICKDEE